MNIERTHEYCSSLGEQPTPAHDYKPVDISEPREAVILVSKGAREA